MKIELLFVTCNRLPYTQKSLPRLLEADDEFELVLWDNGSTDGTVEYLEDIQDPRIIMRFFLSENAGQSAAVNKAWGSSQADLLGKIDNDCLVPDGWLRTLSSAHADWHGFGGIGCWHFEPDDFVDGNPNVHSYAGHRILVNPHIGGTGFLGKRSDYEKIGGIRESGLFTSFWRGLWKSGLINGWYVPILHQEHMDDPRSQHCLLPEIIGEDLGYACSCSARGSRGRCRIHQHYRNASEWREYLEKEGKQFGSGR